MTKIYNVAQVPSEKGYYIAGFVDGEGSFFLSSRPRSDYPTGWKFSANFNVSNKDRLILEICKQFFGCGKIRESRPDFYCLEVSDTKILKEFLIPFFTRFSFLSNKKKYEFSIFQSILNKLDSGIHTESDLLDILDLRKKLGKYRIQRITHTDQHILDAYELRSKCPENTFHLGQN